MGHGELKRGKGKSGKSERRFPPIRLFQDREKGKKELLPMPIDHCPLPIVHCPLPIAHCPI
ncbi:hypothetical protein [Tolypothrix sp. VBCCA 56010]|uniref:hypothetical protein n=1 Tax=Tolypothrix sp. VBCCA 56010 TaxID=3137731 RepID=UPI003D7D9DCC